jgi:hypothetical protein
MGGKGNGQTHNVYYGTLTAAFGIGPVDEILELISDGKVIWPYNEEWKAGAAIAPATINVNGVSHSKTWHYLGGCHSPAIPRPWIMRRLTPLSGSGFR